MRRAGGDGFEVRTPPRNALRFLRIRSSIRHCCGYNRCTGFRNVAAAPLPPAVVDGGGRLPCASSPWASNERRRSGWLGLTDRWAEKSMGNE